MDLLKFSIKLHEVVDFTVTYFTFPIVALNVVTNLISFFIFLRARFRQTSIGFYLACLAIADTVASYIVIHYYIRYKIPTTQGFNLMTYSLGIFFYSTLPMYSPWISVLIALDRYLSVKSMRLIPKLSNRKIQFSIVFSLVIVLSLVNIDILVHHGQMIDYQRDTVMQYYYSEIYPYVTMLLSTVIPFVLMTVFNVATIIKIRRSRRKFGSAMKKSKEKEAKFLKTTITLNIMFFITSSPQSITEIWSAKNQAVHVDSLMLYGDLMGEIGHDINTLACYFKTFYYLLQSVVYYLTNSIYREEVKAIFGRWF